MGNTPTTGSEPPGEESLHEDSLHEDSLREDLPREDSSGRPARNRLTSRLLTGLVILAVIYTLALAQQILMPIALALLFSLVLTPTVRWLERFHIPRALGAGMIVILLLSSLGYGVFRSVEPLSNWYSEAPRVLRQLEARIHPIKKTVEEVEKTAEQVDRMAPGSDAPSVEVKSFNLIDTVYDNAMGLVAGIATTTLLLYFLLSWGHRMTVRSAELFTDARERTRFMELADTLQSEVSKYLFTIVLINLGLGTLVAITLYLFKMPNPLLWGGMAALFNLIPYLGALIMAGIIGVIALLTFDDFLTPLLVMVSFASLTFLEGQVVTPLILGKRLALNPLIVFISVILWFWLWGVIGAFMAVPILIILKLTGDRVPLMRPVAVIAGR